MVQQRDLMIGARPPEHEDYVLVTTRRNGPVIVIACLAQGGGHPSASFYTANPNEDLKEGVQLAADWAAQFGLEAFYLQRIDADRTPERRSG